MEADLLGTEARTALVDLLGYLNFSSGVPDPRFGRNLNELWRLLRADVQLSGPPWTVLRDLLLDQLARLRATVSAFRDAEQAQAVVHLVFDGVLAAYRAHHADLLFHQPDETLFQPFFIARVCEAVLSQGPPWDENDRIIDQTLVRLNDYVGHRPVPALHSGQKMEPYRHEWIAPIPVFLRGAGVGAGPFHDVVQQAMAILSTTEPDLLRQSWFDLELVDELAVDPRAYDFDHPVNKRPNYQFGQWDTRRIDSQGRYRRYILRQITLDVLLERVRDASALSRDEALFEAAAVLAGTMLMAAGVDGSGPGAHDSSMTLATLIPRIAAYRDAFYQALLARVTGVHGERLRAEATALHQPFAGARQHFNQRLSRLRAAQLQNVHLAILYARMGYPEASLRQARIVNVTSARLLCEIQCRLTAAHRALECGTWPESTRLLPEIESLLHRGIECGALVDPWSILGFQGQFSLFPALENSVRDHRVEVLVHLLEQVLGVYARAQRVTSAAGESQVCERLSAGMSKLARWWDAFATIDVEGVPSLSGQEAADAASHVASAIHSWREAGASAGHLSFWRGQLHLFDSPKAYALVIDGLLEQGDHLASMSLLLQWLSQAEEVPLASGNYSFHELALRWMQEACLGPAGKELPPDELARGWPLGCKFLDRLEANAEEYWKPPAWQPESRAGRADASEAPDPEDQQDDLFGAAYEGVTYRDSTDDGVEGSTQEGGSLPTEFELQLQSAPIANYLGFLTTIARLWKLASQVARQSQDPAAAQQRLAAWHAQAQVNLQALDTLMDSVERQRLPAPRGTREALMEYDRRRHARDFLLNRVMGAHLETTEAARWLEVADRMLGETCAIHSTEDSWTRMLVALLRADRDQARRLFPAVRDELAQLPILYAPLSRAGRPRDILDAQRLHRFLRTLLESLPRLGLLEETCQLLVTAKRMEQNRMPGTAPISEFDRLFSAGYQAIVGALVRASDAAQDRSNSAVVDAELIDALEVITEALLSVWLTHSRTLRLSVLERISDDGRWQALRKFVERYGHDLFTPRFMNASNLGAIQHQGADRWLRKLEQEPDPQQEYLLLTELDNPLPRREAIETLELIIDAVLENPAEFKDFDATTVQSDRGELLYILLDFLRLKAGYMRLVWNIRPVVLAHEMLVRRGREGAAEMWRRAVAERTSEVAEWHLNRLRELVRQYGVRLATVSDLLHERFVRSLAIDRIRALVQPALEEARQDENGHSFEALQREIQEFVAEPSGSGFHVPAWLEALEDEAEQACQAQTVDLAAATELARRVREITLPWSEILEQLQACSQSTGAERPSRGKPG